MITLSVFVFIVSLLTSATVEDENFKILSRYKDAKYCLLPPYPEHGRYTVSNYPSATAGQSYQYVKLDVTCDIGYLNNNTNKSIFCIDGEWSATMPRCVSYSVFCTLNDDLRIEYRCLSVPGSLERSQKCPSLLPSGTSVRPICRSPAYFSLRPLSDMHCRDGIWDYKPICTPACGLITQHRKLEGSSTNHAELPWHVVIYQDFSNVYFYICGGSLITANKIISTALCFGDFYDKRRPESDYLVSVNKMYRDYYDTRDRNSQHSHVVDIKIPSSYRGFTLTYGENNIAVAVVEKPFIFHLSVRPVCLDFDDNLDSTQLTEGNSGKVALWYHEVNKDQRYFMLNVKDLQYIKFEDCYDMLVPQSRGFLTSDKICAEHSNDQIRPDFDFGAGLAFLESTTQRYYLRGVLSVSIIPIKNNTDLYMSTSIVKHEHFIKQYL